MRSGGHWSDTHGSFEHHPTYGLAREVAPPRDCAADRNVAQHDQEIFERRQDRASARDAEAARQASIPFAGTAWIATADDDSTVLGVSALAAMPVRSEFGPKAWQRARVPDIPVIHIRAVAVRQEMQGKGLGTAFVIDALQRCIGIADQMGAAAVVLDVLEDEHFDRN